MNIQAQTIESEDQKDFLAIIDKFDVKRYTNAPLRIYGEFLFYAPVQVTFDKMTDPQKIAQWFNMVKGGAVDHTASSKTDDWGEGSKRYCDTSMGKLDETIYAWHAPYLTAYNVKAWSMPIKDHLGVITVQPIEGSHSRVTWSQYFNYKGLIMRNIFPFMMRKMMKDGMTALAKELGGPGGQVSLVDGGES